MASQVNFRLHRRIDPSHSIRGDSDFEACLLLDILDIGIALFNFQYLWDD